MAYKKTEWKNRMVEKPRTFKAQNNEDGTITLIPMEGTIVEPGTPINAENMNNIESGIETLDKDKANKGIYGDGGVISSQSLRVANAETASTLFRLYHANTNHTFQITQSGGFANIQCGGTNGAESGGTFKLSGLNSAYLSKFYLLAETVDLHNNTMLRSTDWAIFRDNGIAIRNRKTGSQLSLKDDGKLSYGGSPIPVVQIPAFEQSVSLGTNKTITVTHNLGYKPLVEIGTTLGNVAVTWQHIDANTIKLFNYSTNEATAYIRCW